MDQVFDASPGQLRDLSFVLKNVRGNLSKIIDAMDNSAQVGSCANQVGRQEAVAAVRKLQETTRILSLFVEQEWEPNPKTAGLLHVADYDDFLQSGMSNVLRMNICNDIDIAWDTFKKFLADKVLGPRMDGGRGIGVWTRDGDFVRLADAFERAKFGKR